MLSFFSSFTEFVLLQVNDAIAVSSRPKATLQAAQLSVSEKQEQVAQQQGREVTHDDMPLARLQQSKTVGTLKPKDLLSQRSRIEQPLHVKSEVAAAGAEHKNDEALKSLSSTQDAAVATAKVGLDNNNHTQIAADKEQVQTAGHQKDCTKHELIPEPATAADAATHPEGGFALEARRPTVPCGDDVTGGDALKQAVTGGTTTQQGTVSEPPSRPPLTLGPDMLNLVSKLVMGGAAEQKAKVTKITRPAAMTFARVNSSASTAPATEAAAAAASEEPDLPQQLMQLSGTSASIKSAALSIMELASNIGCGRVVRMLLKRMQSLQSPSSRVHLLYVLDSVVQRCHALPHDAASSSQLKGFPQKVGSGLSQFLTAAVTDGDSYDKVAKVLGVWAKKGVMEARLLRFGLEDLDALRRRYVVRPSSRCCLIRCDVVIETIFAAACG